MDSLKNVNDNEQGTKNLYFNHYNLSNLGILFAIGLKSIALYPLIFKIGEKKTAEEISIITPILFLIAFFTIFIISIYKKYYIPSVFYFIGLLGASILLAQKAIYDKSMNSNKEYNKEVKNYGNDVNNYMNFSKTHLPME